MPLGAARITLLAFSPSVEAEATVIRGKKSFITVKDPAISTDQSKFGGSSAKFVGAHSSSGTSDVIRTEQNSDFIFTGDFTWECWVYFVDNGTNDGMVIMSNRGSFATHNLYVQARHSDNKWQWGNSTMGANVTSQTWNYNTWYHVAIVRSGSSVDNFALYVNGTSLQTDTDTNTIGLAGTSDYIALGAIYNASTPSFGLNGFIDEVRISPIARYTGSFTPSTTPFVNDEDTVLLAHMDGTDGSTFFEDDNGVDRSAVGVTAINNAQVDTAYSQFGGSSLKVDGVDDALTALFDNTFDASGDFCIELWARGSGYGPRGKLFATYPHHSSLADSIFIDVSGGNTIRCYINGANRVTTGTWSNTTWTHVALQRTGQVFEMFVGGTRVLNYDGGTPKDYSMDNSASFHLGGTFSSGTTYNDEWNGHFDELRFSDTARYTSGSSITVPTAPFVNDVNTALLLHMDGTDATTVFRDDNGAGRSPVGISSHGNAQIDTAQSKFGGASLQLDGNDDYLTIHGATGSFNDEWVNGSEWTVEYWVRGTSFSGYENHFGDWGGESDRSFFIGSDTGGDIMFFYTDAGGTLDTAIRADSQLSTNTWHHIALVKDSSNFTLYVDGSSVDSGASENIRAQGNPTRIGASATNAEDFVGYIDEVRVSNTARYTANFLTQTEPFQNDTNTLLLLHMDGTDASTTVLDDNGVEGTNTVVQPLASGGNISSYNDGTNTYLIHEFTSSGTFTPTQSITIDALLVGAGGGGGASDGGFTCAGGGGGGETSYTSGISATAQGYTITCGTGGSSASNGGDTSALSYTAEGGGYGGGAAGGAASRTDAAGGGGSGHWQGSNMSGGSGTYAGGNGTTSPERGGGGGGNGSAGTAASGSTAGSGGNGVDYSTYFGTDFGASGYFAGGGGGGAISGTGAASGTHGGGSGTTSNGGSATAGTGSGGGGAGGTNKTGGSGSDGVVIIRYAV